MMQSAFFTENDNMGTDFGLSVIAYTVYRFLSTFQDHMIVAASLGAYYLDGMHLSSNFEAVLLYIPFTRPHLMWSIQPGCPFFLSWSLLPQSSKKKWKKKKTNQNETSRNAGAEGVAGVDGEAGIDISVLENNGAIGAGGQNINTTLEELNEDGICTGADKCRKPTKKEKNKSGKRDIKCGKCGLLGHNALQCCNLEITDVSAAAYLLPQ